jgi:hypothetical protein
MTVLKYKDPTDGVWKWLRYGVVTGGTSMVGPQGPQGPAGPPGHGIQVLSAVATPADLPTTGNKPGDGHLVTSTGDLYFWGDDGQWHDIGHIQGPAGPQGQIGPKGDQGPHGVSAFEAYKAGGGDLATEAEWLASLQGPPGVDGQDADPAEIQAQLTALLPSLITGTAGDLLETVGGKLFAPVLPGSVMVDGPNESTVTATASGAGVIAAMAETITNPSTIHALKVDVHMQMWTNLTPQGADPPAVYAALIKTGGNAVQIGQTQARIEGAGVYASVNPWAHFVIPPGGTLTVAPSVWASSIPATKPIARYLIMTVVPIGYEAPGSSHSRVAAGSTATAVTTPTTTRPTTTVAPAPKVAASSPTNNDVRTYKGSGSPNTYNWDGRRGYFGQYSSTNGDQRCIALFASTFRTNLRAIPAGKITKMTLTFTVQHTFNNAGGTVKIRLATEGSLPASMGGEAGTVIEASRSVPDGGSVTVNIPSSLWETIRSSGTGIKFYSAASGQAGYGYLDLKSVKLTVNYTA